MILRPSDISQREPGIAGGSRRTEACALAACVIGNFVVILDSVIVNVALPSIRHDLGGGITGLQWVVDGYTLLFAALLLSTGALSDRVGARRAFTTGLSVFVASSAACGLAPDLSVLVAARFVQGSAAAVMVPSSMALISQVFTGRQARARAVGMWAIGGGAAASAGPVLGGLLTILSWRAIFFVNVPVGVAALYLLFRTGRSARRRAPFDWVGQATAVVAMGSLTYGAIEAGADGLGAASVDIAFALAAVAFAAFLLSQAKGAHPMVPLGLFRTRNVCVVTAVGFAFMVGYYGLPFVMSLYLQEGRGLSALLTGVAFLPMMLSGAALTPFSARLTERFGARRLIARGLLVMAAGLGILGVVPLSLPVVAIAGLMVVVGVTGPMVMPPGITVLLDSVSSGQAGTASGVFNTSRQLGGALAVAVFGALMATPGTFVEGTHLSLLLAASVVLAAAAASRLLRPAPYHLDGEGTVTGGARDREPCVPAGNA